MRRVAAFVICLFVTVGSAQAAPAGTREEALIQSLADEVIILLNDSGMKKAPRQEGLREIFTKYLDLPFIGRFVLGRHWRPLSKDVKDRYIKTFETYLVNIYAKRLDSYSGEIIQVAGSRAVSDKDTIVASHLERASGPSVSMDWRVRQKGESGRVIDVVVEGVSMVISQREEFSTYLQNNSIKALITRLEQGSAS